MDQTFPTLPTAQLYPNPDNPRRSRDDERFAELVASVQNDGVLEPIRVMKNGDGYRIESGHRRWEAAMAAGVTEVPVVIVQAPDALTEQVRALVTNVQREDMNPVDEAEAYLALTRHGLSPEGVAERVGVAKVRVTLRLALLELPKKVVAMLREGELPTTVVKPLTAMAAVDGKLATAAASFCKGNPEFAQILSKEPGRIAYALAGRSGGELWDTVIHTRRGLVSLYEEKGEFQNVVVTPDEETAKKIRAFVKAGGSSPISLDASDVDAARAAGVLYEGHGGQEGLGYIVDLKWLEAQLPSIVDRRIGQLEARKEEAKAEAKKTKETLPEGADQGDLVAAAKVAQFKRDLAEARRNAADAAHAANLELGAVIVNDLASLPEAKDLPKEIAELLALGLVGDQPNRVFLAGIRYCLPGFITEEANEKTGRVKRSYVASHISATTAMTNWIRGGGKPETMIGRALCALLATQFVDDAVLPESARVVCSTQHATVTGGGESVQGFDWTKPVLKAYKSKVPAKLRAKDKPSRKVMLAFAQQADQDLLREHAPELAALISSE